MYTTNPFLFIKMNWRNRSLIKQLIKREMFARYQETHLGMVWAILEPLLMLTVYTVVFYLIFNRHWRSADESILEFAVILFSGLIVFNAFREVVNNSPKLILRNINYVKKVVFPLEILPVVSVFTTALRFIINIFLLLACLIIGFDVHAQILYMPVVLFPYFIMLFGASMFLSSLGVYLRDIGQVMGMLVTAVLFLSAVFYPVSSVPENYRIFFYVNPVAFSIEQFREAVIWGQAPDWRWLLLYYPPGLLVGWMGIFWFQKTRKGFADVL
jgi:lipopolysaccharide transport system permease protein